jgi:hypothetical protein
MNTKTQLSLEICNCTYVQAAVCDQLALNFGTGKMHSQGKVNAEEATPSWIVAEYACLISSVHREPSVRKCSEALRQTNLLVQQANINVSHIPSLFTVIQMETVLQQEQQVGEHADRVMTTKKVMESKQTKKNRFSMAIPKTTSARTVQQLIETFETCLLPENARNAVHAKD